jgi:DNA polymerase elongation subunit (family B)
MKKSKSPKPRKPRIILWDIETLPNMREVMKVFPSLSNYPGLTMKATINSIICVGWKEYGSKEIQCINAWDYKSRWAKDMNDDYAVVKAAYDVLLTADVVVTHNGKRFDWKFLQTRLLHHGFTTLPKIIHIDTCSVSKSNLFAFNNKLNTIGGLLTSEQKMENGGWALWDRVSQREAKAMKTMTAYCKQDVRLLEKVFKRLLPLITTLPNANMFDGTGPVCPTCSSTRLSKKGELVTKTARLQRYLCKDCGSSSSAGKKYPKV